MEGRHRQGAAGAGGAALGPGSLVYLPTPKSLAAASGLDPEQVPRPCAAWLTDQPASSGLGSDPRALGKRPVPEGRSTAPRHHGGGQALPVPPPSGTRESHTEAATVPWTPGPRPPTAQPGSTSRMRLAPGGSASGLGSDVPAGTPMTTPPRARPGPPDPGGGLVPGSEPRAAGCLTPGAGLAGRTRGRSAATEAAALGPRPAGRAPCRPWSHVLCPPCDGVSRHGAVACPALDPGPVQRCGWLRTPEAVSTAHPVSAARPLPWGGLAQVLGAGIRNIRSLGSMRGPNHRHQEGLLFEEAGQGRSRSLRV